MTSLSPKRPELPSAEPHEPARDLQKWFAAVPVDHPFIIALFECCIARQRDAEETEKNQ